MTGCVTSARSALLERDEDWLLVVRECGVGACFSRADARADTLDIEERPLDVERDDAGPAARFEPVVGTGRLRPGQTTEREPREQVGCHPGP
jgi:hypothetical protein